MADRFLSLLLSSLLRRSDQKKESSRDNSHPAGDEPAGGIFGCIT